ncbi:centromere-associated protein E isoform X2 [Bombyx mori]|uniref:Uncharacterized protein n=1 Tax=Bombyx mori TaxID=7091 RepID=A0A8R2DN96_BOMMO|nr:centromere-associated protein E isoform X2 [Bombyx mori]
MIPKWKSILIHWINCYFNNANKDETSINLESLINIIAHLRENFSLDESKSSLLEAHTVEQFILEKYPHFKFENGTVEPASESDFYLAASLLLFFVCVNSKQIDIKNVMCNKLSADDQEVILKFSKNLMESSPVLYQDLQAAITDACGQQIIPSTGVPHSIMTETPPALRSLHSEVRRLQVALDAERFDRNYLQDELARTNSKLEKLAKDKEQYKLEIMDLKAQISLCCGQEENAKSSETKADLSTKLAKDLQEMEERLVQIKGELDDVVYERDSFRAKIEELKKDRDKWFGLSQQESTRVSQLSEQLEIEKQHVATLKELVTEFRQHNRLNHFDSSLLECDDPDASMQILQHNSSISSEVCANVVEVQLGEERAKIVELKQQIQDLQDQLNDINKKSQQDKYSYGLELSEKESEIFNLKHRINEEIEQKDHLKMYYDNEITKLNNEINELEQRLKDNGENSRNIIERKMLEIQTLQEEKLSLLQSLDDESAKLENVIQSLKKELETERQLKANMKESYESHIMKLNEKMLNRNNELVELQNNVCSQSETIEGLYLDLRKENEKREELINKFDTDKKQLNEQVNDLSRDIIAKSNEIVNLKMILDQKTNLIEELYKELNNNKASLSTIIEDNNLLEQTKAKLLIEVNKRDTRLEEIYKDIENLKLVLTEEKDKLIFDLDERNATINTLKNQLESEINYKVGLQNELAQLQKSRIELSDTVKKMNNDLIELQKVIDDKDLIVEELNKQNAVFNAKINEAKVENEKLFEDLKKQTEDNSKKESCIKSLELQIENIQTTFKKQLLERDEALKKITNALDIEATEKEMALSNLNKLNILKVNLEKEISDETLNNSELQIKNDELAHVISENKTVIENLEQSLQAEKQTYRELESNFNLKISAMTAQIDESEKIKLDMILEHEQFAQNKDFVIQGLERDNELLKKQIEHLAEKILHIENEKKALNEKLSDELSHKMDIEETCKNQCVLLENVNDELKAKIDEITKLRSELKSAAINLEKTHADIESLNDKMLNGNHEAQVVVSQKDTLIANLKQNLLDITKLNEELEHTLESKNLMIELLKKEKESLQRSSQDYNNKYESKLKEKVEFIVNLEHQLKTKEIEINSIKTQLGQNEIQWQTEKLELTNSLQCKQIEITELKTKITELEQTLNDCEDRNNNLRNAFDELVDEQQEKTLKFEDEISTLREALQLEQYKCLEIDEHRNMLESQLTEEKAIKDALENEKKILSEEKCNISDEYKDLLNDKAILAQEVCEERSVRRIVEEEKNNLLLEKHALEEQLHNEVSIKISLLEEKACLGQQLIEERLVRELIEKEKEDVVADRMAVQQKLVQCETKITGLVKEIECLVQRKSALEHEIIIEKKCNTEVSAELASAIEEFECVKSKYNVVKTENKKLMSEVSELSQNNVELQDNVDTAREELTTLNCKYNEILSERNQLRSENEHLKLLEEETKNKFNVTKKALEQVDSELVKVGSENSMLLSELENLKSREEALIDKLNVANKELEEMKSNYNVLENENNKLISKVELLKSNEKELKNKLEEMELNYHELLSEKENLVSQINHLKTETAEITLANEMLGKENQFLISEKERVFESLTNEKHVLDQIENEKRNLEKNILEINEIHSLELKAKTEELNSLTKMMEQMKTKNDNQQEMNKKISNTLNKNIEYIFEELKENSPNSETLQKIQGFTEFENLMDDEKCNVLAKIVEYLINEVVLKSKIEKALENEKTTLSEIQEMCNQKEIKIFELETEVKTLQQTITEYKTEFSKKTETYTTSMSSKSKDVQTLLQENQTLHSDLDDVKQQLELKVHSLKEKLTDNENLTDKLKKSYECQIDNLNVMVTKLTNYLKDKVLELDMLRKEKDELQHAVEKSNEGIKSLEDNLKLAMQNQEKQINDFESERQVLRNMITVTESIMEDQKTGFNNTLSEYLKNIETLKLENKDIKQTFEQDTLLLQTKLKENDNIIQMLMKELTDVKNEKVDIEKNLSEVQVQLETITAELNAVSNELDLKKIEYEKLEACNRSVTEELERHKKDVDCLVKHNKELSNQHEILLMQLQEFEDLKRDLMEQNELNKHAELILKEKTDYIDAIEEKLSGLMHELAAKDAVILEKAAVVDCLNNENVKLIKAMEERNTYTAANQETSPEAIQDVHRDQVDNYSEITQSSLKSLNTINDLEKILRDKNRTITTLQSDVSYMKSLMAESETRLMDVTKELELSKESCQQLSHQLKKIVYQKNEEIAELKKQVNKLTVMENRASQIIKVSAKYQAIILRRIAEIKSNTVLKELTNFGNSNTCDNELRRNLNAGTITMEDLENFLETTERHLRRCSEKQIALQKERDRLSEVNRINESEIINLKKFLTEMSVTFQTFNSVKDLYAQKLTRVVSIQRTVRREILSLDGHINDSDMCKLERGYAAVMQDLAECALTMQRWVEKSVSRAVSPEKIKQAFASDNERASFASATFQNAGLEVQLEELENTFQKLLAEVAAGRDVAGRGASGRGVAGRGAAPESSALSEVRAEYEDKLNCMKAKMKQLYQEQIAIFKEKQREDISVLEQELEKARDKLAESSRAYEEHIRGLTAELWSVGEKFLVQRDEAEWLRRKQKSGSLMSLQHVHSSGLAPPREESSRASDAHSLRSLPVNNNANSKKGRGLHMSDEGEVFDNRWINELSATPRREPPPPPGVRLSELRWRNSLCPPHLKSSYPAETQFASALDEEDIKCVGANTTCGKQQRKEVGITAYKKPGPPTPSKQAGRLSATDSELRESLRVEADPQPSSRRTGTPSRFRFMFRSNKNDTNEGTPRRRLSNIFRMK